MEESPPWSECFVNAPKQASRRSGLWVPVAEESSLLNLAEQTYEKWRENSGAQEAHHKDEEEDLLLLSLDGISSACIPHIIHLIWFGDISRLTAEQKRCIGSWKVFNADWTIKIWEEPEIRSKFQEWGMSSSVFDSCPNAGEKSDIARYHILSRMGGVYADVDVECLNAIPESLLINYGLVAGLANVGATFEIANSWIACVPNHPIMSHLATACLARDAELARLLEHNASNMSCQTIARTGPGLFTRVWAKHVMRARKDWILLPPSFLYPAPNDVALSSTAKEANADDFRRPESFAIHWWHKSWLKSTCT